MHQNEIEAIARAFYYTNDNARGWEREPEPLKSEFRAKAHTAISTLNGFRQGPEIANSVDHSSVVNTLTEDLGLPERLRLAPAKFVAVLTGPRHVFHIANNPYRQLVGRRALTGRTVREAFPEVAGQGFFELLDSVFETGESFTGNLLPFMVQTRRNGPPEERLIDLVYKPIVNEVGERLGILVEGRDMTKYIAVP